MCKLPSEYVLLLMAATSSSPSTLIIKMSTSSPQHVYKLQSLDSF